MVAHFVDAVEAEGGAALHGRLGNAQQPGTGQVLAQQHTEHGRLRGVFRVGRCQVQPGGCGVGGDQQLFPALPGAKLQNHRISCGLMDLIDPGIRCLFPDLIQNRG